MAELRPKPGAAVDKGRDGRPEEVGEIDSHMLLGRGGRILIRHKGQRYELRETRFGKLILTK